MPADRCRNAALCAGAKLPIDEPGIEERRGPSATSRQIETAREIGQARRGHRDRDARARCAAAPARARRRRCRRRRSAYGLSHGSHAAAFAQSPAPRSTSCLPVPAARDDRLAVALEDLRLGPRRIVLGQIADLCKTARTRWRRRNTSVRSTPASRAILRRARAVRAAGSRERRSTNWRPTSKAGARPGAKKRASTRNDERCMQAPRGRTGCCARIPSRDDARAASAGASAAFYGPRAARFVQPSRIALR